MKSIFFALLAMLSLSSSVQAATEVKFWINEPEKIIVVAANPTLSVRLTKLEVDPQTWGQLDVNLKYVSNDIQNQVSELKRSYPGYTVQRVVLERNGFYRYSIPQLGVSVDVEPKANTEGPYIADQLYVSKAQYQAIAADIKAGKAVAEVSGSLIGTVPLTKVVERKELDNSVCEKILGRDRTVGTLISQAVELGQSALASAHFQYDSTRMALIKDIKENCFDLQSPVRASSFESLLALELKPRNLGRKLFGETLQKTYEKEEIPLAYEIRQTGEK